MKKIKYGNRKNDGEHKQLQNLKEGDQICEAVLDTLSDDYLDYITHLVKHSKTPIKSHTTVEKEQHSSDSQAFQKPNQQQTHHKQTNHHTKQQNKIRHHSETGGKTQHDQSLKHQFAKKIVKDYQQELPRKLSHQKDKQIGAKQQVVQKKRRKKVQHFGLEADLKNQQKTMSFTRNYQYPGHTKQKEDIVFKDQSRKIKDTDIIRPKYYTNYQDYQQSSNQKISINEDIIINQRNSQRQTNQYTFINQIDNYISHLQSNPPSKLIQARSFSKKSKERPSKQYNILEKRQSKHYEQEYIDSDIHEILKENLKLHKKVKGYQQKIQELEDEVSSHLIQCKNRQKNYKNKISDLVKALTQAVSKINTQKSQISTMKNLLRSFGQKVKQIQNQNDQSDDAAQDISQSIIKYMGPQRHTSELRTKYKRGLESTMPKHEQDRRFWRE